MIRSGFFNSRNHDKLYYNSDISRLFNSLINDGVFQNIGNKFIAKPGTGMQVIIPSGMAYFNSTWIFNDTDYIQPINAAPIVADFSRIDGIFLKMGPADDQGERENTIYYMAGTPASQNVQKPIPTVENDEVYVPICYVTVETDVQSITAAKIENCVGTDVCPFVSGILKTISAEELLTQWEAQWNEWLILKQTNANAEWDSWFNTATTNDGAAWQLWFDSVKEDLATVEVGELKNKVDAITGMYVQDGTLYLPNTAASVSGKKLILGTNL
jgi:hypothetical protein